MKLAELLTWLEGLPIARHIGETWWFPLLESLHVVGATFLVGSILMVDLRLLGLAARHHPVTRIVREVIPWSYGAAALAVATGVGLFAPRATHYAANTAFRVKLALLLLAGINMAVFHLISVRSVSRWDVAAATTNPARIAGAGSLLLWIGIMLAGRWIGHLS